MLKLDQSAVAPMVRKGFKYLNRFMILMWRLGMGSLLNAWPHALGQYMVIVHTGRKTGLQRRTPVNYAEVDGELYCVAGFGAVSDWYRNIQHNPAIEVWLPHGRWQAVAEVVSDSVQRLLCLRQVLIGSGFAAHIAGINPIEMPDAALNLATKNYILLRIKRTASSTTQNGPGDLAWIWPLLAVFMIVIRRRHHRNH